MDKEEKVFILNAIMMPLFMAKRMIEFVNKHNLTIERKSISNLTVEELKRDMMAVGVSFACKKCTDTKEIIKEIRRLSEEHNIYVMC